MFNVRILPDAKGGCPFYFLAVDSSVRKCRYSYEDNDVSEPVSTETVDSIYLAGHDYRLLTIAQIFIARICFKNNAIRTL